MGPLSIKPSPSRKLNLISSALVLLFSISLGITCAQTSPASAVDTPLILPSAIVFDSAGDLYLAESGNHIIRRVDPAGNITAIAGTGTQGFSGDGGSATSATLDSPRGLALDSANNLYISDTGNHRIRKVNLTTGIITTIAGSSAGFAGDNGSATSAQLDLPTALALSTSGDLYLADTGNHRIRKIAAATGNITTIAGSGAQGFSGDGGIATAAAIDSPAGIAIDSSSNLYLADTHNHRIRKIDALSGIITTVGGNGSASFSGDGAAAVRAALSLPQGISVDSSGNLYLADTENHRIRRIDSITGDITTVAGNGTQTFSGDSAAAIAASLDSPRGTALSPSSLVTLADTNNQRVRQLTAQPAPATTITTIAGLGVVTPGALVLSAPSVVTYGSGQLVASLVSSVPAAGDVTFLNTTGGSQLGSAVLTSNAATLSLATVPVGVYSFIASYPGDGTHSAAQSAPLSLHVAPLQISANVTPASVLYGQPVPSISGTLGGVLAQDTGKLSVTFATAAALLSPAGSYPITATLTGAAAGNYTVAVTPGVFAINPAPTVVTAGNPVIGVSSVTLSAHVSSTTTGTPTGSVSLLDGVSPILTTPLSPTGDASFNVSSLSSGSHLLSVIYSGSANFNASSSAPQAITVGSGSTPTPDFSLATSGSNTETISSGGSASFSFSVQAQASLSSPITLAATGLPNLATASFNPAYLPPGSSTSSFTLTIATPNTTASQSHPRSGSDHRSTTWALLLLPMAGFALGRCRARIVVRIGLVAITTLPLMLLTACGDRVNATSALSAPSQTYTITVTGTATTSARTTLQHSATVTLILQPAS
jgi:sugar lactone lactonase YvrE